MPTIAKPSATLRSLTFLLLSLAALACHADDARAPLVGSWDLVAVENRGTNGEVEQPFGAKPRGRITYTADGFLSAHVMHAERAMFATDGLYSGTPAEKAAAYDSYIAYYGAYTVDAAARTVTHTLAGSLFPNWTGSSQTRYYALDGEVLTLSTPPMARDGKEITVHVVWRRAAAP